MQQPNITIKDLLDKNKISYAISSDQIVIWCPICQETDFTGSRIFTFHINPEGKGECMKCMAKLGYEALLEKLGIPHNAPEGAKTKPHRTQTAEIEPNMAPVTDVSNLKPLTAEELIEILGATIKQDNENKLISFLCELSAYTKNSQLNISFNAPSSTGKSYIPTEIARLFPEEDVIEVGYCSPTAFFHDFGEFNKEKQGYIVDLSRRVLIFLDQPHTLLLQHLRPLLSHDKKEIRIKITDKSQKAGLRTKNIFLKGFPAVIFCTAGLKIDEQETTRFILLSPETNQEKIRQAIHEKILKETDFQAYELNLEGNIQRKRLKERIQAIKAEGVEDIKIFSQDKVERAFLESKTSLKPRHQRDIGRILSLIKSFALLNLWFREKDGDTIIANEDDITEAFKVWDKIAESQELNLPPYIYQLFQNIILVAWSEKNAGQISTGLSRGEIMKKHYEVYGRRLADWQLRQQIIPMLENAGLIIQEPDPNDKRKMLVYPTTALDSLESKNYSELDGGVKVKSGEESGESDLKPSELFDGF